MSGSARFDVDTKMSHHSCSRWFRTQDCACSLVCRGFFGVHGCFAQIAPSQDMLRTLHNLLPLDRLCWSAQENELASTQAGANPMWQKGYDGAFKFAGGRRGMKLCELMRADWFRSEPDCYGLRSEFIIDVFLAMLAWMRPHFCQLGQHSTTEERQNHFSHQLRFYGVQLSDAEMESLAGAVVAATSEMDVGLQLHCLEKTCRPCLCGFAMTRDGSTELGWTGLCWRAFPTREPVRPCAAQT